MRYLALWDFALAVAIEVAHKHSREVRPETKALVVNGVRRRYSTLAPAGSDTQTYEPLQCPMGYNHRLRQDRIFSHADHNITRVRVEPLPCTSRIDASIWP